jgi:hypothetical protein
VEELTPASASLILFFTILLFVVPFVFYLITLQNTLKAISPENRKMPPSQVWFLFIPLFGIVWHFIIVSRMADSIQAESAIREIELKESRPGYSIGLAMCIFSSLSIFSRVIESLASISALVFLICWVIYWVKIAAYKKQIVYSNLITLDAETDALANQ